MWHTVYFFIVWHRKNCHISRCHCCPPGSISFIRLLYLSGSFSSLSGHLFGIINHFKYLFLCLAKPWLQSHLVAASSFFAFTPKSWDPFYKFSYQKIIDSLLTMPCLVNARFLIYFRMHIVEGGCFKFTGKKYPIWGKPKKASF